MLVYCQCSRKKKTSSLNRKTAKWLYDLKKDNKLISVKKNNGEFIITHIIVRKKELKR